MWKVYKSINNQWEEIAECASIDNAVHIIKEEIFNYKCNIDNETAIPQFKLESNFIENIDF